jgi:hypothetical protein
MIAMTGRRASTRPLRHNEEIQRVRHQRTQLQEAGVLSEEDETTHTCSDSFFERKENDLGGQGFPGDHIVREM